MKKNSIVILIVFSSLFSTQVFCQVKQRIEDERDGKMYNFSIIGNQTWISENMNFSNVPACWCYENADRECDINGRIYTYESALKACPLGWRLPNQSDFFTLIENTISEPNELLSALSKTGNSSFCLQYAGLRGGDGTFVGRGNKAGYWICGELKKKKVNAIVFDKTSNSYQITKVKKTEKFFSVRCIKNT